MSDWRHFDWVYATYYEDVLRYCLCRASREDGLDAAAETFLVAWRRRTDVPEGHELPWLYGVARRVLANQRRSMKNRSAALDRQLGFAAEPVDSPEACAVRDEEGRRVAGALNNLSPRDREVIRLAAWEDLNRDQLAVALGCSPNAASKRLKRALDHLARELGVGERPIGRFLAAGKVAR